MKFLPDSAIVGTLGRLRHHANKKSRTRSVEVKVAEIDQEVFKGRSVEELLALATPTKAGK